MVKLIGLRLSTLGVIRILVPADAKFRYCGSIVQRTTHFDHCVAGVKSIYKALRCVH